MVVLGAFCASAQLPAFPGAQGFGGHAIGGRFGDVYHVTNLSPDEKLPGSLAYGLATVPERGRTVVFDVSGYIPIHGKLTLSRSKVTIAGQTAPGDGIGLKGGTFLISASDVVVQHVRFRNGRSADSVNLDSRATNCILDHCDVLFGKDENLSSFRRPADRFTFQWSINAWGLETHSAGGLWDFHHATCHHSLWAHNHTRNPKARPAMLDWGNNVTFDFDIGFILGDSESTADWKANILGSWFICPPGNLRPFALEKARLQAANHQPNFTLFLYDSALDANGDGVLNASKRDYAMASGAFHTNATLSFTNWTKFFTGGMHGFSCWDALTGYKQVLSAAGPLRLEAGGVMPLRDELGAILVSNLVNQVRHHVHNPAETGASNDGYGELKSTPAPPDTDGDGLPDFWEAAIGSNPKIDDHTHAVPRESSLSGYTLLEEYLHFLGSPHGYVGVAKPNAPTWLEVDLRRYTSGFTKPPVRFSISPALGGQVRLVDDYRVRFEPKTGFIGREGFDFTVKDGDGSSWGQSFWILVTDRPSRP